MVNIQKPEQYGDMSYSTERLLGVALSNATHGEIRAREYVDLVLCVDVRRCTGTTKEIRWLFTPPALSITINLVPSPTHAGRCGGAALCFLHQPTLPQLEQPFAIV